MIKSNHPLYGKTYFASGPKREYTYRPKGIPKTRSYAVLHGKGVKPQLISSSWVNQANPRKFRAGGLVTHHKGQAYWLSNQRIGAAIVGASAIAAGGYMVHRHRANARAMAAGHGVPPRSGSKPLSAAQINQRRQAGRAPRGHNISSVRSGRRI